jgi:uncharacterized damage-inducible protein DinB
MNHQAPTQSSHFIEHYARGGEALSMAIRGLTEEDLLQPAPAPTTTNPDVGKWSIQQVVLHLADSELVFADRIKRVIAEDKPTLLAFDETKWEQSLAYDAQSAADAAKLVELTRKQLGKVLSTLDANVFDRTGIHSENGPMSLKSIIEKANWHLEHHLKFIHAKRAAMGKEMW